MGRRSKSSKKSGNTKQISAARYWCFTLPNYTNRDICRILGIDKSIVPGFVFQEEKSEPDDKEVEDKKWMKGGLLHLQGVIDYGKDKKGRPLNKFKEILGHDRTHWEKTRDIKASVKYCSKVHTRIGKTYWRGWTKPWRAPRPEPWRWWNEQFHNILRQPNSERKIWWYWTFDGNKCKTLAIKHAMQCFEGCKLLSGKGADMKHCVAKYYHDVGKAPHACIFNFARAVMKSDIDYTGMEEIQDMLFFSGKYDSSDVNGKWPHMIVFANTPPMENMMSEDRWCIQNIDDQKEWCYDDQGKLLIRDVENVYWV
tara:strand:+ start:115 stop:1047 length:933 start_codon:yes stop_codon:yes gene_type:complete